MPDSPPPPSPPQPPDPNRELRLAYQRLASHVENTPLVVIEWDERIRVARWNTQAEQVFGWKAEEVLGKGLLDFPFIVPENRALVEQMMADAVAGREARSVITLENLTKSGGRVWCEWHNSVLYDDSGRMASALSLGLNVTEYRATAEALAVGEARVRAALDSAKMLAWDLDLVSNRWHTTADIPNFYGLPRGPDYSDPENALAAVHPEDVPLVLEGRRRATETGEPMQYEFRGAVPRPDGQSRWFATRGQVLRDASGKPVRIVAVTTDITDRKHADERFRRLLESAPDAMLIVDDRGQISLVNSQVESLFGYRRDELIGQPIEVLVPEQYRTGHPVHVAEYFRNPQIRPMGVGRELTGRRKDRTEFTVEVSLSPLASGPERTVICAVRDVSWRKRAQEERELLDRQLQDAQRWESLGVLAGGIAHDFNNILTVVLGSAALARRGVPHGSSSLGYLEQIEQASRRAAEVCKQMLAYAGRATGSTGAVDLASLVRESAPLLEIPAGHATVRFELAANLPPVHADPAQLRQVLVALVANAGEATAQAGGEIAIRAALAEVGVGAPDNGFNLVPPPGHYVRLTVADTGTGMPPDVRAKMFDPFFTTKFTGRGLGLAAVLGIMRAHKGGIRVVTEPGRGTTVCVFWPVAGATTPPPVRRGPARPAALVVDDEMFVREVTASTLEEMGYAPLLAADGPSAIELFRRYAADVKVAVIDVIMPGMTGDQVLESLRMAAPRLPCVLVSGFTDRRALKPDGGPTEFVQKPFHPEELMSAIRRVTG